MPSTLALRGARAITMTVPQARYARMAYRYGPTVARGAVKIARWAARRYRARRRSGYRPAKRARFSKTNIGERVGVSNSKPRIQVRNANYITRDTRVLYTENLTQTDQGPNRNTRERGIINCRGFRICMAVRNLRARPMYFNCAVVSPKNAGVVTEANFFRASGTARGSNFDNSKTSLEFHCLPINTDKFTILKHKRYRLIKGGDNFSQYADFSGRNYMNIDWYIKLKRQLRYDDTTSESPIDGSVYLVYWCDDWDAIGGASSNVGAIATMGRHIMYFRDTKT